VHGVAQFKPLDMKNMNFVSFTDWWGFLFCSLLTSINIILIGCFVWGYFRIRKALFLILAFSSVCFAYINALHSIESLFYLTHIHVFAPPTMRILFFIHVACGIGSVAYLYGMIALVQFAVNRKSHAIIPPSMPQQ